MGRSRDDGTRDDRDRKSTRDDRDRKSSRKRRSKTESRADPAEERTKEKRSRSRRGSPPGPSENGHKKKRSHKSKKRSRHDRHSKKGEKKEVVVIADKGNDVEPGEVLPVKIKKEKTIKVKTEPSAGTAAPDTGRVTSISEMTEAEKEQAAIVAAIATRAEARAAARAAKKSGVKIEGKRTQADILSLEEMLAKKKKEAAQEKLNEKAVFITRAERERRAKEVEDKKRREKQKEREEQRSGRFQFIDGRKRHRTDAERERDRVERTRAREAREKTRELKAIHDHYMGIKKKKKKIIKPSEKFAKIFQFDWELTEDTSHDLNPLYNRTLQPALAFGRGYVAGVDMREQRKSNKYMERVLEDRQRRAKEEESRNKFSRVEREKAAVERKEQRAALRKRKKKVDADVDRQLAVFDATVHWSSKKLDEMTSRDWRILREDFDIRVRGGRAPNPLRNWDESNICEACRKAIDDMGFKDPSPIQRQAIPIGMKYRDVIGIAETGSGKTAAFVIPMIHYIQSLPDYIRKRTPQDGPLALIMAPTRELALQIEAEAKRLAAHTPLKVVSIVGGQSIQEQGFLVRAGCDIIIATPGRVLDCLENRYLVLNQCNYIVLDEADRMVDLGFEPQVTEVMNSMATLLKAENEEEMERQIAADTEGAEDGKEKKSALLEYRVTSMYSATMPTAVEKMAKDFLRHPAIVSIGDKETRVNMRITQNVIFMKEAEKKKKVLEVLAKNSGPYIIFVNIRTGCDVLHRELNKKGHRSVVLHGGKNQETREYALKQFRDGVYPILVATDVAGRGIDVPGVEHIINFDMPNSIEKYCHRIGRTARAGKTGIATTFLTEHDEETMYDLKQYLMTTNQAIPRELEKNPMANTKPGDVCQKRRRKKDTVIFA